jgi:hypothetical protein
MKEKIRDMMTFRAGQNKFKLLSLASVSAAVLLAAGCAGNGSSSSTNPNATKGSAFVIGTDAPLSAVTSFAVQVQSINAIDASGNQVSLLSGSPTVDFARYNGLQTLLDLNAVPVGTYTGIKVTLGSATIGYLSTQAGSAPTIQTMAATLSSSTVQVTLPQALIVSQSEPVGLRVDFDLRQSIQLDANGQVTGQVTPTFDIKALTASDSGAHVDEFDAAVVSVDTMKQSFVIQGPHGRQFTVMVSGNTEFDNNESLSQLTTNSIVQVSGTIDRADSTIDADEVGILSEDGFFAAGLVTDVQPASGPATAFDLYVRGVLPTTAGITDGHIQQVNLSGSEKFFIYWMHNSVARFLFNSSALLAGQHVAIGGRDPGAQNAPVTTVKRVVLRHWGYNGSVVAGSVDSVNSTFQMNVTGFAGQLIPGPLTVVVSGGTKFRNGPGGLADVSSFTNVRVVGLLIKDPVSGQPVLLAHFVDELK